MGPHEEVARRVINTMSLEGQSLPQDYIENYLKEAIEKDKKLK
jgi:hypothetical protein